MVARRAHNPKVVGSNPAPATKPKTSHASVGFFILHEDESLLSIRSEK